MIQSDYCSKSPLPSSSTQEKSDQSFLNYSMGNSADGSSERWKNTSVVSQQLQVQVSPTPSKVRRRKSSSRSSLVNSAVSSGDLISKPSTQENVGPHHIHHKQSAVPVKVINGIEADLKTVTFSLDSLQSNKDSKKSNQAVGESHSILGEESLLADSHSTSMNLAKSLSTATELQHLKDLVLLHLNFERQQQAIIIQKDKLIADLRSETITVIYYLR